jgi:hypothetical protein
MTIREKLHKQIDSLPDDLIEQIADFAFFMMAKRQISPDFAEWQEKDWQELALTQLFREDDEVEYTLKDAQEIYHS